jgi:parvulin-like peptidyl-prolyl isomerase
MILAQKKLAGSQMTITQEELRKEYETQYGPSVKARLIAVEKPDLAQQIRAKAVANPGSFAKLAKQYSIDTVSASSKGWIPPIRHHSTDEKIESAAFSLKDGQISQVIAFPEIKQYIILKREGLIPAPRISFEQAAPKLQEFLEKKKLGKVGHQIAKKLQNEAKVTNYFNKPSTQDPQTAAVLNGKKISFADLAEECIRRHGPEALEGTISRRLLVQACKKAKIMISEQDIRDEITRAARISLPPKRDGSPDIERWMELALKEQGVSKEVYIRDSVWPSVALKKLVGKSVHVDKIDIQMGYEANYGPRVKCMMIALDNYRRATHVWGLAQKDPTPKNFGDLAEQYSIDPTSRKLRGEIPPLKKHNGHPALKRIEKEAFALKEGELSSIINVKDEDGSDKYIILLCLGKTEPINVDPKEARKLIYEDLFEKKQRIAMSNFFKTLMNTATIDNYLTGESRAPKQGPSPSLKPVKYR